MNALITQYIVIVIPCQPGVVNILNISQKIPPDFVLINGCRATVRYQWGPTIPNATYSLSFNNRVSNPIREQADKSSMLSKEGCKYFKLLEPTQGGTYVQGYLESDGTAAFEDYTVVITLRGKKLINTTKK